MARVHHEEPYNGCNKRGHPETPQSFYSKVIKNERKGRLSLKVHPRTIIRRMRRFLKGESVALPRLADVYTQEDLITAVRENAAQHYSRLLKNLLAKLEQELGELEHTK